MDKTRQEKAADLHRQAQTERRLSHELSDERTIEDLTELATESDMEAEHIQQRPNDRAIAEKAYLLWEDQGRPEGRDKDHWFSAIKTQANESEVPPRS